MIPPKKVHPRSLTGTGVADEEGISAKLWAEFKDHAAYALYNPFVVALAAGTLKMESLLNYLGQDVYYLEKYVEACTMAEDCTDTDDDKEAFKSLIDETKDYTNESQKWISAKACCPNMAAVDYTRFLLATAAGKVEGGRKVPDGGWDPVETTKRPAYTICSMTPCSRLYRFLGEEFANALEPDYSDHPYKQWIEMIFPNEQSPLRTEQMLDKLASSLPEEDTKSLLGRLYYHALNHEIQFFAAVPLYQRTLVPLLKQSVLSNCRYTIHLLCFGTEAGQTHVEPSQKENTSDFKRLCNYFRLVTHPETNAGSEVVGSGDPQDLKEIARQLEQIRRKINSSNVDMHIVSVRSRISRDAILSNDLHIGRPAESAMEKLEIFENIQSPAEKNGMQHISIYIGYKEDVVPRLLEADIGILIHTSSQPARSKKSEVSFVSLFHGVLQQESAYAEGYSWKKQNNTIYTVSSWSEIFAFLFGTYN